MECNPSEHSQVFDHSIALKCLPDTQRITQLVATIQVLPKRASVSSFSGQAGKQERHHVIAVAAAAAYEARPVCAGVG